MQPDAGFLNRIIQHRDRQAFAELVRQHINLVYASACRQVGADHADDLTQAVFCLLWEKPAKIRSESNLAGWLVGAVRLAALQWRRSEHRRHRRERVAAVRRPTFSEDSMDANHELSALLDEALVELSETERSAVVMRYLQDMSVDEVACVAGISHAAAAKRLTRGLDRLRDLLKVRDPAITAESLTSSLLLLAKNSPAPDDRLAGHIVRHATVNSPALAGAARSIGQWFALPRWSTLAASFLIAAMVACAFIFAWRGSFTRAVAAEITGSPSTQPSTRPASTGPIKIGVTVSKFTAITNSPSGKRWGYEKQTRIVRDIAGADVDIYPVIEPDSQDDADLKAQLAKVFPGKSPIDGSDVKGLKILDVLVAHEDWMVPDAVLTAVDQAVSEGLSLLNIGGMGWATPGLRGNNPAPQRLTGMTDVQGGYTEGRIECDVVKDHEILGKFAPGGTIQLRLLGMYGILPPDATPLMDASDSSTMIPRGPSGDSTKFVCYPVYISHLGDGKIIGLAFGPYSTANPAQTTKLLQRSVHWLAGRPVGE